MAEISDPLCRKCGLSKDYVQHCRECCGWGITAKLRYHKFVPRRQPRKQEGKP